MMAWGQASQEAWLARNTGNNAAEFQGYSTTNI
jgi:hypothetical protein